MVKAKTIKQVFLDTNIIIRGEEHEEHEVLKKLQKSGKIQFTQVIR